MTATTTVFGGLRSTARNALSVKVTAFRMRPSALSLLYCVDQTRRTRTPLRSITRGSFDTPW